jgi:hypothetical protein
MHAHVRLDKIANRIFRFLSDSSIGGTSAQGLSASKIAKLSDATALIPIGDACAAAAAGASRRNAAVAAVVPRNCRRSTPPALDGIMSSRNANSTPPHLAVSGASTVFHGH